MRRPTEHPAVLALQDAAQEAALRVNLVLRLITLADDNEQDPDYAGGYEAELIQSQLLQVRNMLQAAAREVDRPTTQQVQS